MVFYRKYRPHKLSELVGQEEIAQTLLSQLESGKVGHGYLFWGPKGTGKTSTARILARAVNCEAYKVLDSRKLQNVLQRYGEPCGKCASCVAISDGSFIDLIEIDAASNRGIDEVRDLREKVKLAPAIGRYKVYIIDEVHMLTNEAFNALLKTLEEPPGHVIFVLATTEFAKLPPTIVSRLMRFNFKRASRESLRSALSKITKAEKLKIEDDALDAICDSAEGSFRDAISILDQVSAKNGLIKWADVSKLVRIDGRDRVVMILKLIATRKLAEAVLAVDELGELGLDVSLFVRQMMVLLEKLLYVKIGVPEADVDLSAFDRNDFQELSRQLTLGDLQILMKLFVVSEGEMKMYPIERIPVVLAICKFCEQKMPDKINSVSEVVTVPPVSTAIVRVGKNMQDVKETVPHPLEVGDDDDGGNKSKRVGAGEVEKSWGEFLNRVRPVNAHVFALLRATRPASYVGDLVTLEVFYRFHKDKLEEPKIIKMLDEQMAEILGKKVRLKFMLADRASRPTVTVLKSDVIEGSEDDLEKIAQEIFSK